MVVKPTTSDLVKDFIGYKLQKAGYEYGRQSITEAPSPIHRLVRQMGDEFEAAYFTTFDDMTGNISIRATDLRDVFDKVLDITFQSGIQWGRICGALVFASKIAVKARDCERTDIVEKITEWTCSYLNDKRFISWIRTHGGWDGFVQFYQNPQRDNRHMEPFNWSKACSFGLNVLNSAASVVNSLLNIG